MIRLRPHHLLCTQSYDGRGYDAAFTANMDQIVAQLREERETYVNLVFSTDDICAPCPYMLGEDHCVTNETVKHIDQRMIHYFALREQPYVYNTIVSQIRASMTEEMFADICSRCNWYDLGLCQPHFLSE